MAGCSSYDFKRGSLIDYSYFDIIARKLFLLSFSFRSYGIN